MAPPRSPPRAAAALMVALHSAMNTAAGMPLPESVADDEEHAAGVELQAVEEIAADRVRARSSSAANCNEGCARVSAARSGSRPIWMR